MNFKKPGVLFAGVILFLAFFCQCAWSATISGVVADSGGLAINGTVSPIWVQAYTGNPCGSYQWAGAASIDTGGAFSITALSAGTYFLRTDNNNQSNYVNEWWVNIFGNSSANCADAQPVTVLAEDNITARNFMLDTGSSISGTVFDSGGTNPITGTEIQVQVITGEPCGWRQSVAWAQTNTSNGTFTFVGLPPGTYYLQLNNMNQSDYVNEWWASPASTIDCDEAQAIEISGPGQAITGKDFQVDLGGSVSGTVLQSNGMDPVTGVQIDVQALEGDPCGYRNYLSGAWTNPADGTYQIRGLPVGRVFSLWTNNMNQSDYVNEWLGSPASTINCAEAQALQISSPGQGITGKNFHLDLGGKIAGTVYESDGTTPLIGAIVQVEAVTAACGPRISLSWAQTNAGDGSYLMRGIPLGTYYLLTSNMGQSDYINEWWASPASTINCSAAQQVQISSPGQQVDGKDFQLDLGGSISGTVYKSDGTTPLTGVNVDVQAQQGSPCGSRQWMGGTWTEAGDGTYSLRGLPLGTYYLLTNNMGQSEYVNEWWASPASTFYCSGAQAVNLTAPGEAVTGKDFQLDLGGSISGKVYGEDGPVEGVQIQVFAGRCGQTWLNGILTEEDGGYTVTGLPPTDVFVKACATCVNHLSYIDKHYDGGDGAADSECGMATPVSVTSGADTPNIIFYLQRGARRVQAHEAVVANGNLSILIWVQPGFKEEVVSASVSMPNSARGLGGTYTFNPDTDTLQWTSECRFINGWVKAFETVVPADYGVYTFTVDFADGVREVYTWNLQDVTVVPASNISVTVNDNGSALVTWNRNTSNTYYYQVRVSDVSTGMEIYRSNMIMNISQLNIPANDLRCLEIGKTYRWRVRVYDSSLSGTYSRCETVEVQYPYGYYGAFFLPNRCTYAGAQNWMGHLSLAFQTRPGSRYNVKSIAVSGPEGVTGAAGPFTVDFNVEADWFDISTETRWLRGWSKEDLAWTPVSGTYEFTVEYDDDGDGDIDYTEVVERNLSADTVSEVEGSTMEAIILADGSINFSWGLTETPNLRYEVRIRSLDEAEEYYSSGWLTDGTTVTPNFGNTRAMVRGETYQWFVRVYSNDGDTVEQSISKEFIFDPAPVYDATKAVFGPTSATLTNPYFPLRLGDVLVYEGTGNLSGFGRYIAAYDTDFVDSVNCLRVLIRGNGNHQDPDLDPEWYAACFAQDNEGNVWMLELFEGEEAYCEFSSLSDAVLWMPGNPVPGKVYGQMVDDYAQVLDTGVEVGELSTGLGPYSDCLTVLLREDPQDYDEQYIAPYVGIVKEEWDDGEQVAGWELKDEIRQGVYDELLVNFGSLGLYHYSDGGLSELTSGEPENILEVNRELFVGFGDIGLWKYSEGMWEKLSPYSPEAMIAVGFDVWIDFGPVGLWRYRDGVMTRKTRLNPEGMLAVGSQLFVDFGSAGLYRYISSWEQVRSSDAENMIAVGSDVYVDFGLEGFWRYSKGIWKRQSTANADAMLVSGATLYVDFGSTGLYKYDNGWKKLSGSNPGRMVLAGTDLYVDFGEGIGVYYYDGTLKKVTPSTAEDMVAVGSDLYVDFGAGVGLYRYSSGIYIGRLTKSNPENLCAAGGVLYADFGFGVGLYRYDGASLQEVTKWDPQAMFPVNLQ